MKTIGENLTPKESEILFRGFVLSITASFLGVLISQLLTRPSAFISLKKEEES